MKRTYSVIIAILGLSFASFFAPSVAWSCHEQNRFSGERIPHDFPGSPDCSPLASSHRKLEKQKQMKESIVRPNELAEEAIQHPNCDALTLTRDLSKLKKLVQALTEDSESLLSTQEEQYALLTDEEARSPITAFTTSVDVNGNRCCMNRLAPPNERFPARGCNKYLGRIKRGKGSVDLPLFDTIDDLPTDATHNPCTLDEIENHGGFTSDTNLCVLDCVNILSQNTATNLSARAADIMETQAPIVGTRIDNLISSVNLRVERITERCVE